MEGVDASSTKHGHMLSPREQTKPSIALLLHKSASLPSAACGRLGVANSTHQQNAVGARAHGKAAGIDVGRAAAAGAQLVGDSHAHTPGRAGINQQQQCADAVGQ